MFRSAVLVEAAASLLTLVWLLGCGNSDKPSGDRKAGVQSRRPQQEARPENIEGALAEPKRPHPVEPPLRLVAGEPIPGNLGMYWLTRLSDGTMSVRVIRVDSDPEGGYEFEIRPKGNETLTLKPVPQGTPGGLSPLEIYSWVDQPYEILDMDRVVLYSHPVLEDVGKQRPRLEGVPDPDQEPNVPPRPLEIPPRPPEFPAPGDLPIPVPGSEPLPPAARMPAKHRPLIPAPANPADPWGEPRAPRQPRGEEPAGGAGKEKAQRPAPTPGPKRALTPEQRMKQAAGFLGAAERLLKAGDETNARKWAEKALDAAPSDSEEARKAKKLLDELP